jgi:hypothetical protein
MSVIRRPDGFYWKDDEDDREYGPFATLLEAGQPDLNEASRAKLRADEEKRRDWPDEA